jgi:hypothetical protein
MVGARRDVIRTSAHIGRVFNLLWEVASHRLRDFASPDVVERRPKKASTIRSNHGGHVVVEEACPTHRKDRRSMSYVRARAEGAGGCFPDPGAESYLVR